VHYRAPLGSGFKCAKSLGEGQKVTFIAVQGEMGMQAEKAIPEG